VSSTAATTVLDRGHDPAREFLGAAQTAQLAHPFLGRLIPQDVWRLVAGRPTPGQHAQVGAVFRPQHLADVVPEVGVDGRAALDLLGGTRKADGNRLQFSLRVPEEQHVHPVVLVAFDGAEVAAAIPPDHGVAVGPTHGAHLAALPRPGGDIRQASDQELHILRPPHHPLLGDVGGVPPLD